MHDLIWPLIILGYFFLYFICIGAFLRVGRKRRGTRWPFKQSDKLLRGPGESLRRKIQQFDENIVLELGGGVVAMVLFGLGAVGLVRQWHLAGWPAYSAILGGPLIAVLVGALRIARLFMERSNWYLGWYGERMAAENLRPLQRQGYHVLHDVPAEPGRNGFNLDHVVVGPTGVTVIEVKTRRKGKARPGRKDHEVAFDGTQLIWPWGDDRRDIGQAVNEADWLRKWIESRTGLKVPVRAILALPGWWVNEAPSSALRVVNPKLLADAVRGRWPNALSPEQVDLIARQLELICRDVEE